jgi:pimeloyl-ACP methyl ester carboxylesterase
MLVHGFPINMGMWANQVQAFAGAHHVIAPDLRGFGETDVTDGEVTMERFADDLAALLDVLEIEEPVVLCGLSMGGYIAFAFWHRHRERLKALVLSDTRATADTPEAAQGRREMADRVLSEGPTPIVEQMLPKLVSTATLRDHPEVADQLKAMMMGTSPASIAAAARGLAKRNDWTEQLGEMDLPALVICGAEDAITPAQEMKQMAAAMPDARYVEVPNAGHVPPMEDPVTFNNALTKFLHELA